MEEAGRNIRVSVVEDNHFIRMALEQILVNSYGYDVVAVYGSGEEAVDKMPDEMPDVVLMDINMGKMSGIEAVRIIKEKCPSIVDVKNAMTEEFLTEVYSHFNAMFLSLKKTM